MKQNTQNVQDKQNTKKASRIWELDVLRGVCIVGVVICHIVVALRIFGVALPLPEGYYFIAEYGNLLFIILSGLCVTLGRSSLKRGLIVFGCGLLITAVTVVAEIVLPFSDMIIVFGILHMLGLCMIIYPLYKRLPVWLIGVIGLALVVLGYYFKHSDIVINIPVLRQLGFLVNLPAPEFASADYFPMLPHLGWFMLGSVLGKTVYRKKQSLFPKVNENFFLIRFFRFCGRHSLIIYLAQQPITFGVLFLIFRFISL